MALYVLVRRDGEWWLAADRNTPIRPGGAISSDGARMLVMKGKAMLPALVGHSTSSIPSVISVTSLSIGD
ncbi:MAG TPA: hypothetical protein VKU38_13810 [Ktedonobacteraceae bacterium]|nr:hypothetical protein [Ktedonobacteraceae bacterium]